GGPSPYLGHYSRAFGCRVEGGWAWQPSHRPLDQTARAVFPPAAFLRCSTPEASGDKTGDQVRQSHQAKLSNQPTGRISAPHRVPPAFGQERIEAVFNPPIQPVEEPPHIRLAIEVPPSANHGIDPLDHLPQR